jgi:autotransporter-associated beta strand protein
MAVVQTLTGTHEISAPISGSLGLMKTGAGTLILSGTNTVFGPVNVSEGELQVARLNEAANPSITVAADASLVADRVRGSALTVGGTVQMRSAGGTSVVGNLTIAGSTDSWTGKLDIGNGSLIIANGTGKIDEVTNQIKSAMNIEFGWFDGNGITSSAAATDPIQATQIGVFDNSLMQLPEFGGETMTGNEVLVKYTYMGDADLNGQVNIDDLSLWLAGLNGELPPTWLVGDFDYNGEVNIDDLGLWLAGLDAYTTSGVTMGDVVGIDTSSVPEPATLALLGLGGLALLRRRRTA